MTTGDIMATVAVAGFFVNLLVLIVGGTLKFASVETSLRESFTAALTAHRREIDIEVEQVRRDVGETIAAIRAKITEIELYTRDNFVRRESFYEVTRGLSDTLKALGDKLENRMERLDGKLDRLAQRNERRDARDGGGAS